MMVIDTIEVLYDSYITESKIFYKDRILSKILKEYDPLVKNYCVRYHFCDVEGDDIKQHVYVGIIKGINDKYPDETARNSIFRNIRKEINNYIIRPWKSKKSSQGKDCLYNDFLDVESEDPYQDRISEVSGICNPIWNEDRAILQMDLEDVIEELNPIQQNIIKMWLDGFGIGRIQNEVLSTNSEFRTLAYYHFNQCKDLMKRSLHGYNVEGAYAN